MGFCDCTSPPSRYDDVTKPRRCTDLFCLIFFLFFWFLLIFISGFALVIGSPSRFIHGSDSFGNTCGHRNSRTENLELSGLDMTDKPYLFHLDYSRPNDTLRICVKKCPDRQLNNLADIYIFYTQTGSSLCRYDYNFSLDDRRIASSFSQDNYFRSQNNYFRSQNDYSSSEQTSTSVCPTKEISPTSAVLYRCVPKDAIQFGFALGNSIYEYLLSYGPLKKIINDLVASYYEMSLMVVFALSATFVTAFTIHYIAGIASWFIMTGFALAAIALTSFMWYAYFDIRFKLHKLSLDNVIPILKEDQNNEQIVLFLAIGITIASIILLLMTCVMRTRVKLVVALFKEAGSCLRSMPLILMQPFWTLLALTIFFLFWLLVLLAIATADHAGKEQRRLVAWRYDERQILPESNSAQFASFTFINYNDPSWIQYMWWYLIIAFFWTSQFILASQQMVIAGAVSMWYFSEDRRQLECPVGRSIRRLILYHMGSVALGSFLITLCIVPRLIITYIAQKLRSFDNSCMKCLLRCCYCCLWLIERFMKYLNHNAYTIISIEGLDFCTSAQIAFNTIVSNALRVTAINSVGDFILFLGKIGVTASTALFGSFLLKNNPALHYWTVPVIVISFLAYWIAHCILSIYEMIIDTLFLCFCEDYNKNDGTPERPYYAPKSLLKYLTGEEVDNALKQIKGRDNY